MAQAKNSCLSPVIFLDLFGTLVKPRPLEEKLQWLHAKSLDQNSAAFKWLAAGFPHALMAEEVDLAPQTLRDYFLVHQYQTIREMAAATELISASGKKISAGIESFTGEYSRYLTNGVQFYEDVPRTLDGLRESGASLYLISNIMYPYTTVINHLNLGDWLMGCVLSCEAGARKPASEIFEQALKLAGIRAQAAVMVGDSWRSDIQGASSTAIRPIFLDRTGNSPGEPAEVLHIHKFSDLLQLNRLAGPG